ncbi:hypothetical protein AR457_39180 [Streptomyces agglomeratus]|uniref:Uncharacterized protein n=1 Tax=Streptomyces agglomeratus TaxID=285458 RepID=A0A1E5PHE2_9ACTN|nr:hypothetical protein AR457_39180 [Streptomyces agglomeratus]OEJ28952.1 hypothetical protein AS594_35570 [Streptomyces agglomeratus]
MANHPVEVYARLILHEVCIPQGEPPQAYVHLVTMGTAETDGDGRYELSFTSDDFLHQVEKGEAGFVRAFIVLRDPVTGASLAQAGFGVIPDASRVFTINRAIPQCLTNSTPIRVMTTSVVSGAEVFVNGVLRGVTGQGVAPGMLYISPPLSVSDQIVARKLISEKPSNRSAHADGSSQDWAFRVYITSAPLIHDATGDNAALNLHVVADPTVEQVLRLEPDNPLVGFHLRGSVDWDASTAQLQNYGSSLKAASDFLYNATDGQMFIEQIELDDDGHFWNEADVRIYANLDRPSAATVGGIAGTNGYIHLNPGDAMVAGVLVHEFGHYGLHVRDEYKAGVDWDDSLGPPRCTLQSSDTTGPFAKGGPKDSCIMRSAWPGEATKICSGHPDNPHVRGTPQGAHSCWDRILNQYCDDADPERWVIRTPLDRNAIIGPIVNPVTDWETRVTLGQTTHPRPCGDVILTVTRGGQPVNGIHVYLRTTYGRTVYQGTTNRRDSIGLADGQIRVTGVHEGDGIRCLGLGFLNFSLLTAGHEVTAAECSGGNVRLSLELRPSPFALGLTVEPALAPRAALIRVRCGAALPRPPDVRALLPGCDPLVPQVRYDPSSGTYIGQLSDLPKAGTIVLEATAIDTQQRQVSSITTTGFEEVAGAGAEVWSADGRFRVEIKEHVLDRPTQLMIAQPLAAPPLPGVLSLVGGPYSLLSSAGGKWGGTVSVAFQFHRSDSAAARWLRSAEQVDIVRLDVRTERWASLGARVQPEDFLVTADTLQPGLFALVARFTEGPKAASG